MHWEAHATVWFTENEREEKYCITTHLKAAGAPALMYGPGERLSDQVSPETKTGIHHNKRVVHGWVPMTELQGP